MTDEQLLQRAITLGDEAEKFLQSSLGTALVERAHDEIFTAMERLKTHDPTDAKGIAALQNEIWRAESFVKWLGIIVDEGLDSEQELHPEYGPD